MIIKYFLKESFIIQTVIILQMHIVRVFPDYTKKCLTLLYILMKSYKTLINV